MQAGFPTATEESTFAPRLIGLLSGDAFGLGDGHAGIDPSFGQCARNQSVTAAWPRN